MLLLHTHTYPTLELCGVAYTHILTRRRRRPRRRDADAHIRLDEHALVDFHLVFIRCLQS